MQITQQRRENINVGRGGDTRPEARDRGGRRPLTVPANGGARRFWQYTPGRSVTSQIFSLDKVRSLTSTVESVHRFCDTQ